MSASIGLYPRRKRFFGLQKAVTPNSPGDYLVRILGGAHVGLTERGKQVGLKPQETSNFIHNHRYLTEERWNEVRPELMKVFAEGWAKNKTGEALDQAMQKVFEARRQAQAEVQKTSAEKTTTHGRGAMDWREAASIFVRNFVAGKKQTPEYMAMWSKENSPLKDPELWKQVMANNAAVPTKHYIEAVEEICRQYKLKDTLVELPIYKRTQLLIKNLQKLAP